MFNLTPNYLVYIVESCMLPRKYLTLNLLIYSTYILTYLLTYLLSYIFTYLHTYLFTYLHNYLLIRRVVLEKLTGSWLAKKFPVFYGNQRFITTFTNVRHISLS